jgi:hypothetical protein
MGKKTVIVTVVYIVDTQAEAQNVLDEVVGVCGPYHKADIKDNYEY